MNKPFTRPFWILLITAIFVALYYLVTFFSLVRIREAHLPFLVYFFFILWPSLLLAEAIVYWTIRKRITERKHVWAHIWLVLFGFVFLQLFVTLPYYLMRIMHRPTGSFMQINYIRMFFFWGAFVIGHTFFIMVLVKAYSRKPQEEVVESGNLLDDVLN